MTGDYMHPGFSETIGAVAVELRWEPVPGFSSYEASTRGQVRSVDRTLPDGRRRKGQPIATRVSNKGYVLLNMTDNHGVKQTRTLHTIVLAAFAGECPPGMEARHYDDNPLHNTWAPGTEEESVAAGGNLFYGSKRQQYDDKIRNGRPVPVPPPRPRARCILCGEPVDKGGRRCHACVVSIGEQAAALLSAGTTLADACRQLDYPSAEGLHTLAVKYGGYAQPPAPRPGWLHRVTATLRDRFRQGSR
jgi:hypothetical protein